VGVAKKPAWQCCCCICARNVMKVEPLFVRDGGTIPALAYFQQVLAVESSIFAFGLW